MAQLIQLLIAIGVLAGLVWLLIFYFREAKKQQIALLDRVGKLDGGAKPTPVGALVLLYPMMGGAGRKKSELILGVNFIFLHLPMAGQPDLVQISYRDIHRVDLEQPDLPQLANVNVAALVANEATRREYGLDVVLTIEERGQLERLVFGGFQPTHAAQVKNTILTRMGR
jgi:hypothetical protein